MNYAYYRKPARGCGVTFGNRVYRHRWMFRLMCGGGHGIGRLYWHGLGSWFVGWRPGRGKTMLDVGPVAVRVK